MYAKFIKELRPLVVCSRHEGIYSRQLLFTNSQLSIFALKVVEESSSRLYLYPWIVKAVLDSFLARVLALIETADASVVSPPFLSDGSWEKASQSPLLIPNFHAPHLVFLFV